VEYRIYLPAHPERIPPGDVAMPRVFYVVDDPATARYTSADQVCRGNRNGSAAGTGAGDRLFKLLAPVFTRTGQPPSPAANPPAWTASVRGECCFPPLANQQTAYLAAPVDFDYGQVIAIRFRAPSVPAGSPGTPLQPAQIRYWSLCNFQTVNFFYTDACIHDLQTHPASDVVIVASSTPQNRPVVDGQPYADWVPATGGGPFLFLRYIDSDPALFPQSPFFVPDDQAEPVTNYRSDSVLRRWMGAYYPQAIYCSRAQFERNRCGL